MSQTLSINLAAAPPRREKSAPSTTRAGGKQLLLAKGEILTLGPGDRGKRVRVVAGTIWMTDTPASGDALLRAGEAFAIGERAPYVLEALSPATVVVG